MGVTRRDTRVIRRPAELRLLSDPRKWRIFEALHDAPASPRELARRFSEKPTALYHHFARLERAGLIAVVETRQRRGVVERLYQPVPRALIVDRAMARKSGTSQSVEAVLAAASTILQVTIEDIEAARLDPSRPLGDAARSEIATIVTSVSAADAKKLVSRLRSLLRLASQLDGSGKNRLRLTMAAIPVEIR
jgi:DNA-binding transcriptional ArsR family regulator